MKNSRTRLLGTLDYAPCGPPPRYESEFSDETLAAWRAAGRLGAQESPEAHFAFDTREDFGIDWGRAREARVEVSRDNALTPFRLSFDPDDPARLPEEWGTRARVLAARGHAAYVVPWDEGLFQVLGIVDGASLNRVLAALCERPALIEAAMQHYAGFVETLIGRVCAQATPDYALLYEPIASNHGPVVSPDTYRRFALPALRRVVDALDAAGVRHRVLWTAGKVLGLVPLWMDAGVNGLFLNQYAQVDITCRGMRRRFGPELRLFGGVNWQAALAGPAALDVFLRSEVRPVLEEGGMVPYLDDTVRVYMPYDTFCAYRARLDALVAEVCA